MVIDKQSIFIIVLFIFFCSYDYFVKTYLKYILKAGPVDRPTCEIRLSLSYLHLCEGKTTKESHAFKVLRNHNTFLRFLTSQTKPVLLQGSGWRWRGVLTCGKHCCRRRGVSVSLQWREEKGGLQRGGPGGGGRPTWWARLIKGLVSYRGPRVRISGL